MFEIYFAIQKSKVDAATAAAAVEVDKKDKLKMILLVADASSSVADASLDAVAVVEVLENSKIHLSEVLNLRGQPLSMASNVEDGHVHVDPLACYRKDVPVDDSSDSQTWAYCYLAVLDGLTKK